MEISQLVIHSLNKQYLGTYCVPGPTIGMGDKVDQNSAFTELTL